MSYSREVYGIPVDEHQLVGAIEVGALLESVLPARAFGPKAKNDPMTQRLVDRYGEMHDLIQRDLAGRKASNAKNELRDYIEDEWIPEDGVGVLPPMVLYLPDRLENTSLEGCYGMARYELPAGKKALILDGESRVESKLHIIEDPEVPAEVVDALLGKRIPVLFHHGIDVASARKYFADINGKGVGINPNLLVSADLTDPWVERARDLFGSLGIGIEEESRQVSVTNPAVLTMIQARTMFASVAHGVAAVSFGSKRIPNSVGGTAVDFDRLEAAARKHFERLFDHFSAERMGELGLTEDDLAKGRGELHPFKRRGLVLRSVPVMVALGALGRAYYDPDGDTPDPEKVLTDDSISWLTGEHWAGIAGKINPSGNFSVASGKESAYTAWRALTDPKDGAYRQIRVH